MEIRLLEFSVNILGEFLQIINTQHFTSFQYKKKIFNNFKHKIETGQSGTISKWPVLLLTLSRALRNNLKISLLYEAIQSACNLRRLKSGNFDEKNQISQN